MSSKRKVTAYLLALLLLAPPLAASAPPCDGGHPSSLGNSSQPQSIAPAPAAVVATTHKHSAAPAASADNRSTQHYGHAMNAGEGSGINSTGGDQSATTMRTACPCCDDCISSCALMGTSLLLGATQAVEPPADNHGLPPSVIDSPAYPPPSQSLFRPPISRS